MISEHLGDLYLASVLAREALDLARREEDYGRQAGVLNTLGNIQHDEGKIEEAASVDVEEYGGLFATAEHLYAGLEDAADDYDWKMRPLYLLDLSDRGVVMIGMTSEAMEAKALSAISKGIPACTSWRASQEWPLK